MECPFNPNQALSDGSPNGKWLIDKIADNLTIVFDHFGQVFPTSERKYLPVVNAVESYNKKFRECKTVVKGLDDEVSINCLQLVLY